MDSSLEAIAIDGPAGAGKTTVARALARRLGWRCLDTGAMYRAVTLAAAERGVGPADEEALSALAASARIEFAAGDAGGPERVLLEGRDVTEALRAEATTRAVRPIADSPGVRKALRARQREIARGGRIVVEGRDIGEFVLPGARWKFFLDAAPAERARRRAEERPRDGDGPGTREALARRDREDRERGIAPLRPAPGAVVLDTTALSAEEVVEAILERVRPGPQGRAHGARGRPGDRSPAGP